MVLTYWYNGGINIHTVQKVSCAPDSRSRCVGVFRMEAGTEESGAALGCSQYAQKVPLLTMKKVPEAVRS